MRGFANASFVTARGADEPPIVFVDDANEVYEAITPGGRYKVEGDRVTLTIVLVKNNQAQGAPVTVSGNINDKDSLVKNTVKAVTDAARKL